MDCCQTPIPVDRNDNDCSVIDDFLEVRNLKNPTKACPEPEDTCGGPSECELESEVLHLSVQIDNVRATITDMFKCHNLAYKRLAQDFRALTRYYENTTTMIVERQRNNDELHNTLCCKTAADFQTVEDVERLMCDVAQIEERNKITENKIREEQMIVDSLERQLECSEESIARLIAQTVGLRCKEEAEKYAVAGGEAELQELCDRNAGRRLEAKELTVERREREAVLATFKESSPMVLAAAARSVDTARMELADACDVVADWEARRARADVDFEQAHADGNTQRCRARAALEDLAEERERLAKTLTELEAQLKAAKGDRQVLATSAKTNADRIACLKAEAERSKQRLQHKRLAVAAQQANIKAQTKSIEDQKIANCQQLAMVDCELQSLNQIHVKNEMIIKNARQELQEQCSVKAC